MSTIFVRDQPGHVYADEHCGITNEHVHGARAAIHLERL